MFRLMILIAGIALMTLPVAADGDQFVIAENGAARAVIVHPYPYESQHEVAAVEELADCLGRMTGATFEVVSESEAPDGPQIHVGYTKSARYLQRRLERDGTDIDGFAMVVKPERIFLVGRLHHSTEFAVYRFLYRFCGVRWYMPTDLGMHVPAASTIAVAVGETVEEPAILSRLWSGVSKYDGGRWEVHNLCRGRFSFHHALLDHMNVEGLYDEHPEWYPVRPDDGDDQRYRPGSPADHSWQPCMTEEPLMDWLAARFIAYFDANPNATSVSIGVNDSDWSGYCQCSECRKLMRSGALSQHGGPDYSDLFFHFANGIAERVAIKHPDKHIGCLAYHANENPPSFPVHPMIIPYLTNDRGEWYDRDFRQRDLDWISAWRAVCPSVGVYSYDYGSMYIVPRIYPHVHEDFIKFLDRQGVKGWYSEIYSRWCQDGPKAWIASQLMWDPDQDADALLGDFCHGMFGAAANPMRRYFDLCERVWMTQPGEGKWFRYYYKIEQLALYPDEVCREAEGHLARAAEAADSDLARERVEIFAKGFRLTRLYSDSWHASRAAQMPTDPDANMASMIEPAIEAIASDREREALESWMAEAGPVFRPAASFSSRAYGGPTASLAVLMTTLNRYQTANDQPAIELLLERLEDHVPESAPTAAAHYALQSLNGTPPSNLATNPDFETLEGDAGSEAGTGWQAEGAPPGWSTWQNASSTGEFLWLGEEGNRFVTLKGMSNGVFLQNIPVTPGKRYLVACSFRGSVETGVKAQIHMAWRNDQGNWTAEDQRRGVSLPNGQFGHWLRTGMVVTAPGSAAQGVLMLTSNDQIGDEQVAYDNVLVTELP